MMDLWATVPYYTAYLSSALRGRGVMPQVGSITYYLDRDCFRRLGIAVDPGILDVVGKVNLPRLLRRLLKAVEGFVNLSALVVRFTFARPDILHVQYLPLLTWRFSPEWWFLKFCRWRGMRIVLTVHDLVPHDTANQHTHVFRQLYQWVDALICHSENIREQLTRSFAVPFNKISVIPHGPFFYDCGPLRALAPGKQPRRYILWQGIILPYKGVDLLLRAWQLVETRIVDLDLVVLGTGAPELTARLGTLAKELGLTRVQFRFEFVSVATLTDAYQRATGVVYPYRAITTSGALATGLALGKAIVASDLPVFRESLAPGEALLADPQDTAALADAIVRIAEDQGLRESLEAKVQAKDFGATTWTSIAEQTDLLYRSLMK
jgi:glycosyltransferase involved in cell wall biosynthesis